ncbi:hypothetical protein NUW58_g3010 [Xylaria curta]|uniref:Uncharacterized protein n=1 Tax=Xylaria curta TaxID=42375 RepID=A0ACC1PEM3_9PEZI|nr:hypothetical protein NUW58_g3010 [Xylaria curta]
MSDIESFSRFGDLPVEIRLLIWEHHFDSYFKSPLLHTLNGGFLSRDTCQLEPLSSLRSITSRGRLLKSLADRYDWHTRDVPILQWKTVIHDLSPVSGKIYSAHGGVTAAWPKLRPLINHEAFSVARARCKRYDLVDLWLDNSTLNISQPCLVDIMFDVFRIDPGIAKMMLGLNGTYWLARVRRLAIGPFEPRGHFDSTSILRIVEHTRDLDEIYVLLSPEFIKLHTCRHDWHTHGNRAGFSMVEVHAEGYFGNKMSGLDSPPSESGYVTGDSDCAAALRSIVHELRQKCSRAKITYGCLKAIKREAQAVTSVNGAKLAVYPEAKAPERRSSRVLLLGFATTADAQE